MSITTTASGSVKSKATTRPVSVSFGPISGSPECLLEDAANVLGDFFGVIEPHRCLSSTAGNVETYSELKNIVTMMAATVNLLSRSHHCLRALRTIGQRERGHDLVDHELGGFGTGGGAAVGVLLDGVADVPQSFERRVTRQVETCDCALGWPPVTGDRDVENPGPTVEVVDRIPKIGQEEVRLGPPRRIRRRTASEQRSRRRGSIPRAPSPDRRR